MIECKKEIPCYNCICYGSYNTGGKKYCKCGRRKTKKTQKEIL
jgi:hypothetical protein